MAESQAPHNLPFHMFDRNFNKLGTGEVTYEGQKLLDLAVIVALVVQERSDEWKEAVAS